MKSTVPPTGGVPVSRGASEEIQFRRDDITQVDPDDRKKIGAAHVSNTSSSLGS